jgi:membrane-associated protease RseP (regulator of RpoE activity)
MKRALLAFLLIASVGTSHADDVEPLYTCKKPAANAKLRVMFAPETSVYDLVSWAMGFTCKNIVFSADVPKYATKITVLAPSSMNPKQAFQLFVHSLEAAGLVVVQKGDTIIIKLGPTLPKGCPDATAPTATNVPTTTTPGLALDDKTSADELAKQQAEDLAKEVDAGIRKIDVTHYEIKKSLIDMVLANPMAVAKGARVVPAVKNGKAAGFKLYAIRPSSLYAKLGFTNGDTIVEVNGFELTSADKALEVYTKVREATSLDVEIERRGKLITLQYTIKD